MGCGPRLDSFGYSVVELVQPSSHSNVIVVFMSLSRRKNIYCIASKAKVSFKALK